MDANSTEKGWTPGPWQADHNRLVWSADGEKCIADVGSEDPARFGVTLDEARANARVVAAAPEMLEALHVFLDCFDRGLVTLPKTGLEIARAALAKVEGR
jgi:hypothetical protein